MNKIINETKFLTILITGASSNGKSSLASRTFGLNVGIGLNGATTTTGIRRYDCEKKRLSLIDTPGLEKKNNDETIKNLSKCKPDIIWLVLNFGSSIEAEELSIPELFPQVPTIVVLNKVDTLQYNKLTDDDIKDFDCLNIDDQVVFPEKLKNNKKLMAVRQRLIDWKLTKKANIHRILITSLRNEMPSDKPIGLINLCEATWMSCGYVASVTFTQAQQVYQNNMINVSIAIVMSSIAVA
jgi:small GTP-binding protein